MTDSLGAEREGPETPNGDDVGCVFCGRRVLLLRADGAHAVAPVNAQGEPDVRVALPSAPREPSADIPPAYFALNRILGLVVPKREWLKSQPGEIQEAVEPVVRALALIEREATAARDEIQRAAQVRVDRGGVP
jgi:hypothetical protein